MSYEIALAHLKAQYPGRFVLYCRDLAQILSRSEASISHLLNRGHLPFQVKRVGRERCVDIYQVAEWLAASTEEEKTPPKIQNSRDRAVGVDSGRSPEQSVPMTPMMAQILQQRHDAPIALARFASQLVDLDERCFMVEVAQRLIFSRTAVVSQFVVALQLQKIVVGGFMRAEEKFFFDSYEAAHDCFFKKKIADYGQAYVSLTMKEGRKLLHQFSYVDGSWVCLRTS